MHLECTLTRARFDDLTAHLVAATRGPVQQAMSDAGIKTSDLSRVLLVGGSTRIPAVQEEVRRLTGKEPARDINPDECVAMGACLQGGVLTGTVNSIVLIDVTPLSLGIETLGDVFAKIIDRNTPLPCQHSQVFTTAANFQTSVEINVLQGEREIASANKSSASSGSPASVVRSGAFRRSRSPSPLIQTVLSTSPPVTWAPIAARISLFPVPAT